MFVPTQRGVFLNINPEFGMILNRHQLRALGQITRS